MQPDHVTVLKFLAENTNRDECFLPFAPICEGTGLDRKRVQFICRALRRKGHAEFSAGLWDDDGQPVGAGYCITNAGREALALHHNLGLRRVAG